MEYAEAINLLTSKGMFRIDLGLDRIALALEKLGNPQDSLKCIHVAGTNGKGSVCAIIDSVLREAGYKTGLYTSPHIYEYTERIKVNGAEISEKDFARLFEKVISTEVQLTEFEILTAIMFLYFSEQNVDYVVLETGMGGRFDATNVIKKNLCSIITHIDLDHTDRLGKTKDEIASEKAGIIKSGCPVFTSSGNEAIKDKADEVDSLLVMVNPYVRPDYIEALSLKGLHQVENLALAINAIEYLFKNIDENTILRALARVKNPFRFQYFADKNLIVDASHNPNGIEALRENLDFYFPNEKRRFVFGCLKTKDYAKMMNILFREGDEVYLNGFDYPNACSYEELKSACPVDAKRFERLNFSKDKLNVVCGSFYMIGKLSF